jgi:hypothetical protein
MLDTKKAFSQIFDNDRDSRVGEMVHIYGLETYDTFIDYRCDHVTMVVFGYPRVE